MRGGALVVALLALASPVLGQDGPLGGVPVGQDSLTVGEASLGTMRSETIGAASAGSVRGSSRGSMLSPSVEDGSAGSVHSDRRPLAQVSAAAMEAAGQPAEIPPLRLQRPLSPQEIEDLGRRLRDIEPLTD